MKLRFASLRKVILSTCYSLGVSLPWLCCATGCGFLSEELGFPSAKTGAVASVVGVQRSDEGALVSGPSGARTAPRGGGEDARPVNDGTASTPIGAPSSLGFQSFLGFQWQEFNRALVSVDRSGEVVRWPVASGRPGVKLGRLPFKPLMAAFCPGKGLLGIVTRERAAVYSLSPLQELKAISIEHNPISALAFDLSGDSLLLGGMDGSVLRWLWRTSSKSSRHSLERYIGPSSLISSLAYHPAGRVFFVGDLSGGFNAWLLYSADLFEGKYDRNIFRSPVFMDKSERLSAGQVIDGAIDALAVSVDAEWIALGTAPGELFIWKARGFRKVAQVTAHLGGVRHVAWAPDNKTIITSGRDDRVRFWSLETSGYELSELKRKYEIVSIAEAAVPGVVGLVADAKGEAFAATLGGTIVEIAAPGLGSSEAGTSSGPRGPAGLDR